MTSAGEAKGVACELIIGLGESEGSSSIGKGNSGELRECARDTGFPRHFGTFRQQEASVNVDAKTKLSSFVVYGEFSHDDYWILQPNGIRRRKKKERNKLLLKTHHQTNQLCT